MARIVSINENFELYKSAYDNTNQFIAILDNEMNIKSANKAFLNISNSKFKDISNTPYWDLPLWSHSVETQNEIMFCIERIYLGEEVNIQTTYIDNQNEEKYVEFTAKPIYDDDDEIASILTMGYDITDVKLAERKLKTTEKELEVFFDTGINGYLIRRLDEGVKIDYDNLNILFNEIYPNEKISKYNKSIVEILEIEPSLFEGDLIYANKNIYFSDGELREIFVKYILKGFYKFEKSFISKHGYRKYVEITIVPIIESSIYTGCFYVVADITSTKNYEQQLFILANFDSLTEVSNRRYFLTKTNEFLQKEDFEEATICIFDIDNFKSVNDYYGHDVGDIVLKELAKQLDVIVKQYGIFSRLGGEEFAAFLNLPVDEGIKVIEQCLKEARKIEIVNEEKKSCLRLTISGGVSNVVKNETTNLFLKRADDALYKAKDTGRNRVVVLLGKDMKEK